MNVLLTFDNGYAPHAAVVMESIIANCNNPKSLTFYVLFNDISIENQDILKKHFSNRIRKLSFIKVEDYEFKGCENYKSLPHINNYKSALLRLFVNKIPDNNWILYLDCDTIIQDDITKLAELYDEEKVIGAVTEYNASYKFRDISILSKYEYPYINPFQYEAYWYRTLTNLDMDLSGKYFCSGVMLINIRLWKEKNYTNKLLEFIYNNSSKCFAVDQDALNHQVNGNYIELPPRWGNNVTFNAIFSNYSSNDLKEAIDNPAIIHVAGSVKPWMYMCDKKNKDLYLKYRKKTPWPKIVYTDKTIINIIKVYFILPIYRFLSKLLTRRIKNTILFYKRYGKSNFFSHARI